MSSAATTDHLNSKRTITYIARGVTYFLYFYIIVVEIILTLGFFLLLFGANPSASFVEWVYRALERVMDPFRGMFAPVELGLTGNGVHAVLDTSILFAMLIYLLIAIGLQGLIRWLTIRLHRLDDEQLALEEPLPPPSTGGAS
jgi:hypothetical protein